MCQLCSVLFHSQNSGCRPHPKSQVELVFTATSQVPGWACIHGHIPSPRLSLYPHHNTASWWTAGVTSCAAPPLCVLPSHLLLGGHYLWWLFVCQSTKVTWEGWANEEAGCAPVWRADRQEAVSPKSLCLW